MISLFFFFWNSCLHIMRLYCLIFPLLLVDSLVCFVFLDSLAVFSCWFFWTQIWFLQYSWMPGILQLYQAEQFLSLWACEMQTEVEAAVSRLPVHIPFCLVRESGEPGRLILEPVLLFLCWGWAVKTKKFVEKKHPIPDFVLSFCIWPSGVHAGLSDSEF